MTLALLSFIYALLEVTGGKAC